MNRGTSIIHYPSHKDYLAKNPELLRSSQAYKNAKWAISQAQKSKGEPYAAVGQALTTYLSDRLNQPVVGLTQNELGEILSEEGIPPSLNQLVVDTLILSEMGRFAPSGAAEDSPEDIYMQAEELIVRLEKALS